MLDKMTSLETDFHRAMLATYEQATELGYPASYFLQMVQEHGGVQATKRLLAKQEVQQGLMQLYLLGHLEISMEAYVLQDRFKSLFTKAELAEAHQRLDKLRYFQKTDDERR